MNEENKQAIHRRQNTNTHTHFFPTSPTTDNWGKQTGEMYTHFHHRVWLFAVIMFYTVTTNPELVKTKSLFQRKYQGQVPVTLWSQYFQQPINMSPCFRCIQDTLFNIYCWLMNIGLTASRPLTQAWMNHLHMYFLQEDPNSCFVLKIPRQHFSTRLEGHFKWQNHQ